MKQKNYIKFSMIFLALGFLACTPKSKNAQDDKQKAEAIDTITTARIDVKENIGGCCKNSNGIIEHEETLPTASDTNKIYDVVEQMPSFPGGDKKLLEFIANNLKYPKAAISNRIQGTVIVRFVVSQKGYISNVEVLRSLDPACDKEALRVVRLLSQWIPGKQNGVNVPVYFTLPIKYKLD